MSMALLHMKKAQFFGPLFILVCVFWSGFAVFAWAVARIDGVLPHEKEHAVFLLHAHAGLAIQPAEYFSGLPARIVTGNIAFYRFPIFDNFHSLIRQRVLEPLPRIGTTTSFIALKL